MKFIKFGGLICNVKYLKMVMQPEERICVLYFDDDPPFHKAEHTIINEQQSPYKQIQDFLNDKDCQYLDMDSRWKFEDDKKEIK